MLKGCYAAFLAMSLMGMAQTPPAGPAAPIVSFREYRFYEWPADPVVRAEARISPSGYFIAAPLPRQDKWAVALNGAVGPKYDAIVPGSIIYSPTGVAWFLARDGKDWLTSMFFRAGERFDFIEKGSFIFSKSGYHLAFVAQRGGKSILVLDLVPGVEWDSVIAEPSGFCHDERTRFTFAYIAVKGATQRVVMNRDAGPEFDDISRGSLVYSGDDKFFGYIARKTSKWQTVINGQLGEPYDGFSENGIVFSPLNRISFAAKIGDKYSVWVDGYKDIEAPFDHVGPLIWARDRLAYVVQQGQKKRVVCDRGFGPEVLAVLHNRPFFFREGRGVLYTARLVTNRWAVFEDGQPGPACDEIEAPIFTQDTKRFAYAARRGSGSFVVVDGREDSEYESVMKGSLSFDPAGGHVLYAAVKDGKAVTVLDRQPGQEYDEIVEAPFFDRFGRGYAYVARKEQERFVVINGKASRAFNVVLPGSVVFSPEQKRVAYAAVIGTRWAVYAEGRIGGYYDEVSAPVFSDDGKHLAYLGRLGNSWHLVVDGAPSAPFQTILSSGPVFNPKGAASIFGVRNGWLYRVESVPE